MTNFKYYSTNSVKRRDFIQKSVLAASAFTIVPRFVLGKGYTAPSDTLYMAGIGVGGRGNGVLNGLHTTGKVKFVALADVDDLRGASSFNAHPKAKAYRDFRKMYDAHLTELDAVFVATPDHTHAVAALPWMRAGKHVYVEKPLTHTINEARLMREVAEEKGIVTQMGNQGSSSDGIRQAQEIILADQIGSVQEVDCWTNRPVWPQGMRTITTSEPVPTSLDWDLWLGPAEERPYHSAYLPFKWRGFWDFGTGALGDMGCHIMETPYRILGELYLGSPTAAEASCTTIWSDDFIEADFGELCPPSSIVRLEFGLQNLTLNWYDGGLMPKRPDRKWKGEYVVPLEEKLGNWDGGSIFYGEKGIMITDTYSGNPRVYLNDGTQLAPPEPHLERVAGGSGGHIAQFVDACLANDPKAVSSPFSYAGGLTESVLMGNLAIQAYQHKVLKPGKTLEDWAPFNFPGRIKMIWKGDSMRIENYPDGQSWVTGTYRDGWGLG